jgi:RNA polymerase sigma factor (sigma-70 family)
MSAPDADPAFPIGKSTRLLLAEWSLRYRRALLSFFRRRAISPSDQEDLVQEVFLRLARRSDLQDIQDVDRYIFRSASNVLTDWRRQRITHAAAYHDDLSEELPDVGFDPERVLLGSDALNGLIHVISTMPARTQTIFALYHFDQRTHAEIARALGIAVRTVEDHMARANACLMSALGRDR